MFLPADVDLTAAKVYFTASDDVTLDGEALVSGGSAEALSEGAHTLSGSLSASGMMNIIRWNSASASDPVSATGLYAAKVANGESFIQQRCLALTKGFSENTAMLYYNANGCSGNVFNPQIAVLGETVTVIDRIRGENRISSPGEGYQFAGWNTSPDGSGSSTDSGVSSP